jgi:hypothetical protein
MEYKNLQYFRSDPDLYVGPKALMSLEKVRNTISASEKKAFLNGCRMFYIELIAQIFQRFPFNEDDVHALKMLSFMNPANIKDIETIAPAAAYFQDRIKVDVEELENEFRHLQNSTAFNFNDEPLKFWLNIARAIRGDNSSMFPELSTFVRFILTLPHSTAAVERVFSVITNNKDKKRNRLQEDTLSAILLGKALLKREGKSCFSFSAPTAMINLHKSSMYKFKNTGTKEN